MLSLCKTACTLAIVLVAMILAGVPSPPLRSSDPDVAELGDRFEAHVSHAPELTISSRGVLKRDRDTFFWSMFSDKFGSNPNTPYMWNALPLFGFLIPSPMWHLRRHDAVVLLSRLPPRVEYFSFTTFALFSPRRGLPFSSLGDSINNLNIKHSDLGLFAHVVASNQVTYTLVKRILIESGLPESAINLAVVPADLGLFEDWTHFETVMRIFRFENQTQGNAYLKSHHPVFYLRASHAQEETLPTPFYKDRAHVSSFHEGRLKAEFTAHDNQMLHQVGKSFHRRLPSLHYVEFAPLMIQGLECLKHKTECLGDCPDAAYFGPHIREDSDDIHMLKHPADHELHVVTIVNHRLLNASTYSSIAILKAASDSTSKLSKTHMKVFATPIGVTSFDFPSQSRFVSWAFTSNPEHCTLMMENKAVDGCSLLAETEIRQSGYLTYCERIYLNPATATGPHWADILPARLYHVDLQKATAVPLSERSMPEGLPPPMSVTTFLKEPLRFLHIIKTGGESLENYLAGQPMPRLDFSTCRGSALRSLETLPAGLWSIASVAPLCLTAATGVSIALCGLNCECCAADIRLPAGGFHGTLLRSPRAHVLSLFSHGHVAHHPTLRRAASDVSLFLAERILRATEIACNSSNFGSSPDWKIALQEQLEDNPVEKARPLRVLPMDNTQAHALTCSKSHGSLGHHFRSLGDGSDAIRPKLESARAALHRFEWIGLTDLFEPSLCLLHFQSNGSLPSACNCNSLDHSRLWNWVETRSERRSPDSLSEDILAKIDEHTSVDAALFKEALRLLLGRLRRVEELTGASILRCIDWPKLWRSTRYIPDLWAAPNKLTFGV